MAVGCQQDTEPLGGAPANSGHQSPGGVAWVCHIHILDDVHQARDNMVVGDGEEKLGRAVWLLFVCHLLD